jgi:hypothetical protein
MEELQKCIFSHLSYEVHSQTFMVPCTMMQNVTGKSYKMISKTNLQNNGPHNTACNIKYSYPKYLFEHSLTRRNIP